MRKLLLISIFSSFLISFSACKKKSVEIPPDILKKKQMVALLTDVHIAEAAITQQTNNGKFGTDYTSSYYKFVFEKNKISAEQYKRSLDWYAKHPEILDKVYEDVINRLSKKQSEVDN